MIFFEHSGEAVPKTRIVQALSNPICVCLLLAATTLIVFWPVTRCDFLNYDDPDYFTSNPRVLSGLTSANFVWAFTTGHASNWHPLTWLSLMLDAQIFGKNPFGPHLTNLLFHTTDTILLFLLLRRLTSTFWRSAIVAALFALHPLHVESVAWISERKDVLSTFFALLSLLNYARFAKENRRRSFWFALIFFALALMSKPMMVTLPFVMLLLDWWPLERFKVQSSEFRVSHLLLEKIPFFVLSATSCAITFIVQQKGGAVAALAKFSMPERIANAFVSYARYLGKTFWPVNLANPYPHPVNWKLPLVILSTALVIGLSVAAMRFARKFPFVFTGWFLFAGTLVPVIGLVQVGDAAMADRYTYFPLIGIFIILAWGAGFIFANRRVPNSLIVFCAAIVLAACAFRTRGQLNYWQNSGTLFRHTLAVTENNYIAENNLGTWMSANGRIVEAMDCFHQSLQIKPDNADAFYNLGNALAKLGNWDEAVGNYRRALQITPNQADILNNLGFALAAKKQFPDAIASFESALKLNPDSAGAHNNLGSVLFRQGKFEEAGRHFYEALRLEPDNPRFCVNLGDTLVRLGNTKAAAECYRQALQLEPDNAALKTKLQAPGMPPSN